MSDAKTSETDLPEADLPDVEVAEADLPETDLPETDLPDVDLPEADLPDVDLAEADLPDVEVPEADLPEADLPEAELSDAEGAEADVSVADPGLAEETAPENSAGSGAGDDAGDESLQAAGEEHADEVGQPSAESSDLDRLENEGDIAADYLEELLDIADLDGDLDMDVEGDRAAVSIVGGDVRLLVGRDGEVLEALQELTRLAVYRETGERSRLMLDVGGFRADKRSRLEKVAAEAVAEVQSSGTRLALDPMSPFERKVVHDVVAAAGLSSASEGEEPRRHVVVLPR